MTVLADAIKRVATGPHLSKDLTLEDARAAMSEILSGDADEVQAAIFFIALRMKIETEDENLGILQAIQAHTQQEHASVEQLMILSDPFNGFNRHYPVMAFLPAVMAAAGLPALTQGVKTMGPKFGITHSQVLAHAGLNVDLSIKQATAQINDTNIAWAYVDQEHATPSLHALTGLRTRILKRPSLSTLEKLVMPVKASGKTHLQIGYVHKAYPKMLGWLAQKAGFDSALIVRGIEGGVIPVLTSPSRCYRILSEELKEAGFSPSDFGIEQKNRAAKPDRKDSVTVEKTVELAMEALNGQEGIVFDSFVYATAMALWHTGLQASEQQASDHVREVILSGKAKEFFENAK